MQTPSCTDTDGWRSRSSATNAIPGHLVYADHLLSRSNSENSSKLPAYRAAVKVAQLREESRLRSKRILSDLAVSGCRQSPGNRKVAAMEGV
jgi:hypothetical protein